MTIILRPYDIGCEPSPSVPAETVVQDGWSTYILFFAVSKTKDESGFFKDLGIAVVECEGCSVAKFGYPNDEGRPEHPLFEFGLGEVDSNVLEVVGSTWTQEVAAQRRASAERIWGRRNTTWKPTAREPQKHFIIPLKEKTFECVANSLKVVMFAESFQNAIEYVHQKLGEH